MTNPRTTYNAAAVSREDGDDISIKLKEKYIRISPSLSMEKEPIPTDSPWASWIAYSRLINKLPKTFHKRIKPTCPI